MDTFKYWPDDGAERQRLQITKVLTEGNMNIWTPDKMSAYLFILVDVFCSDHRKWCTVTHSDRWRELLIFFSPVERGGACCPAQFRCLHGHTWFKWTGRYLPDHLTQVWWSRETFALHLQPHLSSSHRHKHLAVFIFFVLISKCSVHTRYYVWSKQNLWFYLNWTSL